MQKEPKKSRQNECSAVLPARAHEQPDNLINHYYRYKEEKDHAS
jgi:hypothetical protein